jgi:hypothetical protein
MAFLDVWFGKSQVSEQISKLTNPSAGCDTLRTDPAACKVLLACRNSVALSCPRQQFLPFLFRLCIQAFKSAMEKGKRSRSLKGFGHWTGGHAGPAFDTIFKSLSVSFASAEVRPGFIRLFKQRGHINHQILNPGKAVQRTYLDARGGLEFRNRGSAGEAFRTVDDTGTGTAGAMMTGMTEKQRCILKARFHQKIKNGIRFFGSEVKVREFFVSAFCYRPDTPKNS